MMRRPSPGGAARRNSGNRRNSGYANSNIDGSSTQDQTIVRGISYEISQAHSLQEEEQKQDNSQQQIILENNQHPKKPEDAYPYIENKYMYSQYQTKFEQDNSVLSLRYSNNSDYVAAGFQDGGIKVINVLKQNPSYSLKDVEIPSACTAVRWCPSQGQGSVQNTLIASYSNGDTIYWHATSQNILHRYTEPDNPLNALDISPEGTKFVTGGQDGELRLYDLGKKSEPKVLESSSEVPKHQNRVYGVKFDKNDPNLLISGSWDQKILFWDIRTQYTVNYIYGPKIYSDSFDIHGTTLLTGSWREKKQLELFDMRRQKKLSDITWVNFTENNKQDSMIYCCQFNKNDPKQIIAGSSGTHELRLFQNRQQSNQQGYQFVDYFTENLDSAVYCCDFSTRSDSQLAYGCSDGTIGFLGIKNS